MKGKFITLEGPEGSGKTTVSNRIVKMLEEKLNKKIFIAEDSQIIGALGAAIIGFK